MTGSNFTTEEGRYVIENKEIDPFGTNVTEPPTGVLLEPSWLDPRKDFFWPVEYEANWTGEAERGMAEYASRVNADYDRRRAEYFWSTGRRDIAMEIVANNPNVGLEVRSFRVGETVTFSIFGSNAANYLLGLSSQINSGALAAATPEQASAHLRSMRKGQNEEAAYVDVMSGDPLGGGGGQNKGVRGQLTGDRLEAYKNARARALEILKNSKSCKTFLLQKLGLSTGAVARAVRRQRAFDGLTSTISAADAGLVPHSDSRANYQVKDLFVPTGRGYIGALQAGYASREDRGASQRDVYYGYYGFDAVTVIHETLHSFTGLDDDALYNKLGGNIAIQLMNNGCG
jgi:hypothetical protein